MRQDSCGFDLPQQLIRNLSLSTKEKSFRTSKLLKYYDFHASCTAFIGFIDYNLYRDVISCISEFVCGCSGL